MMALRREADEKCGLCGEWRKLVLFDDGSIAGVSHNCPKWTSGPVDPPRIYTRGAYFPQHPTEGRAIYRDVRAGAVGPAGHPNEERENGYTA